MKSTMGADIIRVFRCDCGKMHMTAYVSANSRCACDRQLWPQVWAKGR